MDLHQLVDTPPFIFGSDESGFSISSIYQYLKQRLTNQRIVWSCVVMSYIVFHGILRYVWFLWSCKAFYGLVLILCGLVWFSMQINILVWSCKILNGLIWSILIIYGLVWHCIVLRSYAQFCACLLSQFDFLVLKIHQKLKTFTLWFTKHFAGLISPLSTDGNCVCLPKVYIIWPGPRPSYFTGSMYMYFSDLDIFQVI